MAPGFRTLWISDVHLGTRASRAAELLEFLSAVRAERIYLVGDIVDIKCMGPRPYWPEAHLGVLAEIVRLAGRGTEVIFVPGNHDHEFRSVAGRRICGIEVMPEAIHTTPQGRKLLVTHGDVLDGRIRSGTNLEKFGATAYALLQDANVLYNRLRARLGGDYLPISTAIKQRLKSANEYIERFETVAAHYALERGFDGIVCGHIHRPGIRMIDGCLYANDGDWVEHRTALAEGHDGALQLIDWKRDAVDLEVLGPASPLAA